MIENSIQGFRNGLKLRKWYRDFFSEERILGIIYGRLFVMIFLGYNSRVYFRRKVGVYQDLQNSDLEEIGFRKRKEKEREFIIFYFESFYNFQLVVFLDRRKRKIDFS